VFYTSTCAVGAGELGSFGDDMNLFRRQPANEGDQELLIALREFIGAFEVLFHHDWSYAKGMIGDEEEGCTFLKPGLDDEIEDWGSRGELLEKYRKLKEVMEKRGLQPIFNPHIKSFLEQYGQWIP